MTTTTEQEEKEVREKVEKMMKKAPKKCQKIIDKYLKEEQRSGFMYEEFSKMEPIELLYFIEIVDLKYNKIVKELEIEKYLA